MKNYAILKLFLCIILIQSCSQDDVPSAPDPNLFLGTWELSSKALEGVDSIEINDCTRNSRLLLYRSNENNPFNNAEIYDYELDEMGECIVVQNINKASWNSLAIITNKGIDAYETVLYYYSEQGDTLDLNLEREGDLLKVTGNTIINGSETSISRTYIKLEQEFP